MSFVNEIRKELIDVLLSSEKAIQSINPKRYIYENVLLLTEENIERTMLECENELKANGFNCLSDIIAELKKFKLNQGYECYSENLMGKTSKVRKYRYGDYYRLDIEKKIALTDEELFIFFCNHPKTYKKRIALANIIEKECKENKDYFSFLELIDFSALNKEEREIIKEYKEEMRKKDSFAD